jgi:hypothetical protein
MLIKAMNTLELDQIGCSTSFLTTFKNISELLQNSPEKFRALMKATPTDLYYMYPGLCKTKEQIEIVVEAALENEGKFRGITNEVLTHFGDRRDEEYLTELYRHCLEKIIELR